MSPAPTYAFAILPSIFLLACVGLGVWLLATCRRPGPGRDGTPTCGACGYNLTGLDGNYCPECGRKFIDAGIIKTANERTLSKGRLIGGIVLLCLPVLLALLGFVWASAPPVATPARLAPSAAPMTIRIDEPGGELEADVPATQPDNRSAPNTEDLP